MGCALAERVMFVRLVIEVGLHSQCLEFAPSLVLVGESLQF
jgi:hypothetical protein